MSIFDVSAFFFQLPVITKHHDRMTIISPRSLEISKVAIMGFKNSPSYAQRLLDRLLHQVGTPSSPGTL
jgi:hypothetical protein